MIQPPTLTVFNIEQSAVQVNHVHPFTEQLLETFVIPNIGSQTTVEVLQSSQYRISMWIWISGAGFFRVTGTPDATHIYVINDGVSANGAAGSAIPIGTVMMPCAQPDLSYSATVSPFALYDLTTEIFVAPAGTSSSVFYLQRADMWCETGMTIFVEGAGFYKVLAVDTIALSITVMNVDSNNMAAGLSLTAGAKVWPAVQPSHLVASGIVAGCNPTLSTADETIGTVTFTKAFTTVPNVVLSYNPVSALGAILVVYPTAITVNGFTIKQSCGAINDVNINVQWIASNNGNL